MWQPIYHCYGSSEWKTEGRINENQAWSAKLNKLARGVFDSAGTSSKLVVRTRPKRGQPCSIKSRPGLGAIELFILAVLRCISTGNLEEFRVIHSSFRQDDPYFVARPENDAESYGRHAEPKGLHVHH